jgi:hypothetical protein
VIRHNLKSLYRQRPFNSDRAPPRRRSRIELRCIENFVIRQSDFVISNIRVIRGYHPQITQILMAA